MSKYQAAVALADLDDREQVYFLIYQLESLGRALMNNNAESTEQIHVASQLNSFIKASVDCARHFLSTGNVDKAFNQLYAAHESVMGNAEFRNLRVS